MIITYKLSINNIFLKEDLIMVFDEVKEILADQLDIKMEDITMESDLADDLGADSIDAIDIVMSIEDQYSIEVPDETIESMKTVEDIVSFIENNIE
jgi:acyl carrier protein